MDLRDLHIIEYLGEFYKKDGSERYIKKALVTSDPYNAIKNPSEMFAARGSDVLHRYKLNPVEKTLISSISAWFKGLTEKLRRFMVDTKGIDKLFDEIVSDKERAPWSEAVELEYAKGKGETLDMLGLQSIYEKAAETIKTWKGATKPTEGKRILAEVKGADWGLGNAVSGTPIFGTGLSAKEKAYQVIAPYFVDPTNFSKGTINEKHVYNTNLAEMFIAFQAEQHRSTLIDIQRGLDKDAKGRVTTYLREQMDGKEPTVTLSPNELASAEKARGWLDIMKNRYKLYLMNEYKANLNKSEFGALQSMIAGATPEQLALKYPKMNEKVLAEIAQKYADIDKWGIEDYIPNVELGRFKILANATASDGTVYRKLVGIGLSESDAVRKATKYAEDNPNTSELYIDSDLRSLFDDKTTITHKQYGAMIGSLAKKMEASIEGIDKGVARNLAHSTLKKKFKISPTEIFSEFVQEKQDILRGEQDIFPVLDRYAYSMEKKMALDPVIDGIKRDLGKMNKYEKQFILDYIEDIKGGKYGRADQIVDAITNMLPGDGTYRGYSRLTGKARSFEAQVKLGYRPVAAGINFLSGQGHNWVKAGTGAYVDAIGFLKSAEGKEFIKDVEPFLGTSIIDIGGGPQSKTPMWKPLGMFQSVEPFNREVAAASAYRMALKEGLSKEAAFESAIKSNWAWQFTYNLANLPKIMRGPTGRLLTQFKPYLFKEIQFAANLSGPEWVRYLALQLALGGPKGAITIAKTIPVLAAIGAWQQTMDEVEKWANKNYPLASRGIGGLPGLIKPEYAVDITAPATIQFPSSAMDIAGPALSDMDRVYKVVAGLSKTGINEKGVDAAGGIAPIFKYYHRLYNHVLSKDNWLLDDKGNKLYEVKDNTAFIIQSVAGTESVELNRIKSAQSAEARTKERESAERAAIMFDWKQYKSRGQEIPAELREKARALGMTGEGIAGSILEGRTDPRSRTIMNAPLYRRRRAVQEFPTQQDYR
jgi:hypothetical protein